ncbi:uncharacterized protein [Drosophila tropicalis]|uniref:uncharacterized protein n=1 Tax=Drosophila tropicalis TaxID=46794 RepID=UPI0035ABBE3C
MSSYKLIYGCRFCGTVISEKSLKVCETHYDVIVKKYCNLIEDREDNPQNKPHKAGELFLKLCCKQCRVEMGLHCLASAQFPVLKGLTMLLKCHLYVFDSYDVPFEVNIQ